MPGPLAQCVFFIEVGVLDSMRETLYGTDRVWNQLGRPVRVRSRIRRQAGARQELAQADF
jgi:hypothetical protein